MVKWGLYILELMRYRRKYGDTKSGTHSKWLYIAQNRQVWTCNKHFRNQAQLAFLSCFCCPGWEVSSRKKQPFDWLTKEWVNETVKYHWNITTWQDAYNLQICKYEWMKDELSEMKVIVIKWMYGCTGVPSWMWKIQQNNLHGWMNEDDDGKMRGWRKATW